jgi:uncharacterized protein YkwD
MREKILGERFATWLKRCLLTAVVALVCMFTGSCATTSRSFAATSLEREVLNEMNLARTDPRGYANYLREFRGYFQGNYYLLPGTVVRIVTNEGVKAVDGAIRFLQRQKPLEPMTWSPALARAAAELADEQRGNGDMGHVGRASGDLRQRIERYGRWQVLIGENISYGPDDARLAVISLIVDDGVAGRGHRKNIFSSAFRQAGVACAPHPSFGTVCVTDFAGSVKEK